MYDDGPIRPHANVGENLLLIRNDRYELYRISFIEPLPLSFPLIVNGGALAASTTILAVAVTNILDLAAGQLGQYRARVLDDIDVRINQPAASGRFGNLAAIARITPFNRFVDPWDAMTEINILEALRPTLDITNRQTFAIAQARVAFYGYKYILEGEERLASGAVKPLKTFTSIAEADESKVRYSAVPVTGWGR